MTSKEIRLEKIIDRLLYNEAKRLLKWYDVVRLDNAISIVKAKRVGRIQEERLLGKIKSFKNRYEKVAQ